MIFSIKGKAKAGDIRKLGLLKASLKFAEYEDEM